MLEQLRIVDAAPRQAVAFGPLAVEDVAEDDGGGRPLRSQEAAHHPRVPTTGVQAQLQEPGVEPG